MNFLDSFVSFFIGIILGLLLGSNFVVKSYKLPENSLKIESFESKGNKCSYKILDTQLRFKADCGKFNVGDIVSFERVK